MAYYLYRPEDRLTNIAPSLEAQHVSNDKLQSIRENGVDQSHGAASLKRSPVLPTEVLDRFEYAFLIRQPSRSIPSFFRGTVTPLVEMTGFVEFLPSEAGYHELRQFFDLVCAFKGLDPTQVGHFAPSPDTPRVMNDHSLQ